MSKEILILTPIGRIKWLKAPTTLAEILYHLGRTFKVPEMCIVLKDEKTSAEIADTGYVKLLESENDLVWNFTIDEVMKNLLSASEFNPLASKPKLGSMPIHDVFDFIPKSDSTSKFNTSGSVPAPVSNDPLGIFDNPEPTSKPQNEETLVRSNSRVVRGKTGKTVKSSVEDPRMSEGLKTLRDYGFTDMNKCRLALTKANFSIEQAIEYLV
jgi:hypothetical protein